MCYLYGVITGGVPKISGPVRLRRFHSTDVENLVELDSDPEVRRYLFCEPPTRHTVQNDILPAVIASYEVFPGFGRWAAELAESGRFIGWFCLSVSTKSELGRPELGYRLRREHWGQHLASMVSIQLVEWAFAVLGAETVRAETMAVNVASRRVLTNAGLHHIRTFHVHFDDRLPGTEAGEVEYAIHRNARPT